MIKNISVILAFVGLFTNIALAGLPPTTVQGQSDATPKTKFGFQVPYSQFTDLGGIKALIETGNKNLLANASFEASTFSTGWTLTKTSGTTMTSAVETSTVADGKQAAKITLTAAYGTWDQSVTPTVSIASQNYEAYCRVNISSAVGNVQVCALEAGAEQNCAVAPVSSTYQYVVTNFVAKTNGDSLGVRVKSTVADTTNWFVDDCTVMPATNLGSGTFTTPLTAYTPTFAGFGTPTGVSFASRRDGDYIEIQGSFTSDTTTATPATFTLPSVLTVDSSIPNNSSVGHAARNNAAGGNYNLIASGGGTTIGFSRDYTTAANQLAVANANAIIASGDLVSVHVRVKVTQYTDQSFYRADSTPASWAGTSTLTGTTTSTTITDPGSVTGSVSLTTSVNMTCTAASSLIGISCTVPKTGNYQVCYGGIVADNATPQNVQAQLTDGSNVAITGLQQGDSAYANAASSIGTCMPYNVTSLSSPTVFKLRGFVSGGTGTFKVTSWSVTAINTTSGFPLFTGSVSSNSTTQGFRMESAIVNNPSGTCSITSQSGSWATLASSTASAGGCTINIAANEYTATPACWCTLNSGAQSTNNEVCYITAQSSSAFTWRVYNASSASQNESVNVFCMGPH